MNRQLREAASAEVSSTGSDGAFGKVVEAATAPMCRKATGARLSDAGSRARRGASTGCRRDLVSEVRISPRRDADVLPRLRRHPRDVLPRSSRPKIGLALGTLDDDPRVRGRFGSRLRGLQGAVVRDNGRPASVRGGVYRDGGRARRSRADVRAIRPSRLDKVRRIRHRRRSMKRTFKRILKVLGIVVVVALLGGGAGPAIRSTRSTAAWPAATRCRSARSRAAAIRRCWSGASTSPSRSAPARARTATARTSAAASRSRWGRSARCKHRTSPRAAAAASTRTREFARLILHGVKRDGHGLTFMPAPDFAWWPDEDVVAVISYLRTVPPVARPSGEIQLGLLAKVIDRLNMIPDRRRAPHRPRAPAARADAGADRRLRRVPRQRLPRLPRRIAVGRAASRARRPRWRSR